MTNVILVDYTLLANTLLHNILILIFTWINTANIRKQMIQANIKHTITGLLLQDGIYSLFLSIGDSTYNSQELFTLGNEFYVMQYNQVIDFHLVPFSV